MTDKLSHQNLNRLKIKIRGMHCVNCEVLIERKFRKIAGIRHVYINHARGMAKVTYSGALDVGTLQNAIAEDGYIVSACDEQDNGAAEQHKNTGRDYLEIGAAFLILVGLFFSLKQFDFLPQSLTIFDNMSYGLVFLVGLVASVSSCLAVTGGLLVAVAAKYNEANTELTGIQRLKPHIYFNAGRIISYTLLGGAIGAMGSAFTLSSEVNGVLMILASTVMIVLGLQMLKLFPSLGRFLPRMPKFLAHSIHDLAAKETKGGAFVLGVSTFFLPCGFTQALQLYVLAKGSFVTGTLTMLAFSLGTLPALVSLSALSSFASGTFQRYFLRLAGTTVIFLGFINIQYGFVLTGSNVNAASIFGDAKQVGQTQQVGQTKAPEAPIGEKQIVNMKVAGLDYFPNRFTVTQGVPVEWRIDAQGAYGCGRVLIAPKIRVRRLLSSTDTTVITFTPQEPGDIYFNCGMGMMTRGSKIAVLASATGSPVAQAPTNPAPPARGQAPSSYQRADIERITKEYLLQHPEVLREALIELQRRERTAEAEQHRAAVKENAETIFNSSRQVVLGNPQGDVTMVEFFDYNCGYCKRALSDMLGLLKADPKLRVVLKEFPVLGDASVQAAQVAVAVRMQDKTGDKYLEFHQKLLGSRGQADRARALAVAKEIGLDMARLEKDMASDEVKATIEESIKLAEAIGITGTPSYVVGSNVVIGAIGLDALREKINAARK